MIQVMTPRIINYYAGSETATHTPNEGCTEFSIINDGSSDLTFAIGDNTITVKPNETFDGSFKLFTSVTVTTTVAYRCTCASYQTS